MNQQMPDGCIFCRIVAGDLPSDRVAETELSIAIRDINPTAPIHVLVLPRRHEPTIGALAASSEEVADVFRLAQQVAEQEGVADAHRMVVNTGSRAGQTVFHAHLHILAGTPLTEGSML
jgi:histidine triad (HIT) family protein